MKYWFILTLSLALLWFCGCNNPGAQTLEPRMEDSFNAGWRFALDDSTDASQPGFDDSGWYTLNLPHDWSIEGMFSENHPSTPGGGALPGGIGWYRKSFSLQKASEEKLTFIEFDGIYHNSEVWINGHYLGKRPNGYISFSYELTSHLFKDGTPNVIAVKVDNSQQPNSRWYSGSGIYREVRLVTVSPVHVDQWGTFVTTPEVSEESAGIKVLISVRNSLKDDMDATVSSTVLDASGKTVVTTSSDRVLKGGNVTIVEQNMRIDNPGLWSVDDPWLYTLMTEIRYGGELKDRTMTTFGIRDFKFDAETGFYLNRSPLKLNGVCNHHDLGCLGAAAYPRAMERQLELLKEMGCNAIRTSHNPPSPALLDLCDRMGFLVMDETFDMWEMKKSEYDYHMHWDDWHERDLADHVKRDRNHPSVIIWSIGNEIIEQRDSSGVEKAIHLAGIVRELDHTRPITSGCNETSPKNSIMRSGALDVIGFNYHHEQFINVPVEFPGIPFIASETTSALATRGYYDMPSDCLRIWPGSWDQTFKDGNQGNTCSSYDNCHVPWGSTHEAALLEMKENDFVSGMFVWTGFDYLGEPTPYWWPSRSSYFGILDLAGFPKDAYYLYQGEWTDQSVLHLFPHWNWNTGDTIDVWTYTTCREVELFLNGVSLGVKEKQEGSLHMQWRVPYEPGKLLARGVSKGQEMKSVVETTGEPARIQLRADRQEIHADPLDLSFVTVKIVDQQGRVVPSADNLVTFRVEGDGEIVGVDNGLQTSMESFKASERSAFNGLCLVVLKSAGIPGSIVLQADSKGLQPGSIQIDVREEK